jgi:hypothetical protein
VWLLGRSSKIKAVMTMQNETSWGAKSRGGWGRFTSLWLILVPFGAGLGNRLFPMAGLGILGYHSAAFSRVVIFGFGFVGIFSNLGIMNMWFVGQSKGRPMARF